MRGQPSPPRRGRLLVLDRMADLIVSGGENVYSAEVERVLLQHPGIEEAVVVGRPHVRWGEAVIAVVIAGDTQLEEAEVRAFCRKRSAAYKVPRAVVLTDDLPRNPMGKLLKRVVREQIRAGRLASGR